MTKREEEEKGSREEKERKEIKGRGRVRRDQGSCVDNSVVDGVEPIMDDQELLKRN